MAKRLIDRKEDEKQQLELIDILAERSKSKIRIEISRAVNAIMEEFKLTGTVNQLLLIEHRKNLSEIIEKMIKRTGNVSFERILNLFNDKSSKIKHETKAVRETLSRLLSIFSEEQAYEQSNFISNTTNNEIDEGIRSTQQQEDITDRDDVAIAVNNKVGKERSVSRSKVIGLTVVHSAFNWSSENAIDEMQRELDLLMEKEWITAGDEHVRPEHQVANGQLRNVHEEFSVGGEGLRFPGDPAASLGNIINCRCVMGYIEKGK